MSRGYDRALMAGKYVAQQARRNARGGDFDYAMSDGSERFRSAGAINTDTPRGASAGSLGDVESCGLGAAEGAQAIADRGSAWASATAPTREQGHGSTAGGDHTPREGQPSAAHGYGRIEPPADPRIAPQMSLLELRELAFRLPQPISVNELYRVNLHTGAKYLTEPQKQFRSQVIGIVRAEMRRCEQRDKPLLGRIDARVLVSDRLDIDNGLKSLLDGLQHAKAFANDRQIVHLVVDRIAMPRDREYCDVRLREIAA